MGKKKQIVKSVDHVNFHILRNETFGLVGESGCGKTTVGRTITRLYEPTEGKIILTGRISAGFPKRAAAIPQKMQMISRIPTPP